MVHKISSRAEIVLSFEIKPNGVLRWLLGSKKHTGCSLCWGKGRLILRVEVLENSVLAFNILDDLRAEGNMTGRDPLIRLS